MSARHRSVAPALASSLEAGLAALFGFGDFRPGQRDVMQAAIEGRNALVVMPTGSGKSLCYQLPACVIEGMTLVISPLIALMKDQVDALEARGIPATFINSSISPKEQQDRIAAMEQGHYKIVYVAPERFRNETFCRAIKRTTLGLFAIDEAHCISSWGHDFRPDYLLLDKIRADLGYPPTIALTATATSKVQRDILAQLSLSEAEVFVYGFERPNLFFEVFDARSKGAKLERAQALIEHVQGHPTLIYCATRKQVEELSDDLHELDIAHGLYHGGLSDSERERVQDAFMRDEFHVLIATNAFGMGVDKSNIRAIIHYNIPGSIEAYYQEAGRAGRDGQPSHCLLLFNYADRGIHEFFTDQSYPSRQTVERIWEFVSKFGVGTHAIGAEQIATQLNRRSQDRSQRLNSWGVESALRILQRAAHLEFGTRDGFPWIAVHDSARARDLRVDWEYLASRRDVNADLLADVVRLASGRDCRQLYLLRYFNSRPSFQGGCGHCDACCGPPSYALDRDDAVVERVYIKDPLEVFVQKTLSGVARARGRFGAHMVAAMLRGAKSQKLQSTSLVRLTTYGLLAYVKQPDLVSLLDLLMRHDLLSRDEHGCIAITELGMEVMRAPDAMPERLRQRLERRFVPKTAAGRRQQAEAKRPKLLPAVVRPAAAQAAQTAPTRQARPAPSSQAPASTSPVAPAHTAPAHTTPARPAPRAAKPSAAPAAAPSARVAARVAPALAPAPTTPAPTTPAPARASAPKPATTLGATPAPPLAAGAASDGALEDAYGPTLELLRLGRSLDEIARERELKMQTVLRHLMVLADRGERFDLSALIKPRLLEAIRKAAQGWRYGDALAPVKEAAPACSYDDLKIHLAQILMERHDGSRRGAGA